MSLNINHIEKNKLLSTVYRYLDGEDIAKIKADLNISCNKAEAHAKTLYKSIVVDVKIENALFNILQVPQSAQKNYRNKEDFLKLLTHLHQDGYSHGHLAHLLVLIDKTKYHNYKGIKLAILSSFTLINVGAFFHIYPEYLKKAQQFILSVLPRIIFDWIKKTFSILQNLTFIGIIYTSVTFLSFFYHTFYHGFSNLSQKLTATLFKGTATSLSLTAYVICFLAAGVATPLTGILFISSSALDVVQSVVNYCMIRFKSAPKDQAASPTWEILADKVRRENQRQHAGKTVWINLGTALLLTGLVTMWCFFPPSILLTIGCMATSLAINTIKSLVLSRIETQYTVKLQHALQAAAKTLPPSSDACENDALIAPQLRAHNEPTTLKLRPQPKPVEVITPVSNTSRGTFFHHPVAEKVVSSNDKASTSLQLRA